MAAFLADIEQQNRVRGSECRRICVGSVGYSCDPYHWLRDAIFDEKRDTIIFKAPEGPILVF